LGPNSQRLDGWYVLSGWLAFSTHYYFMFWAASAVLFAFSLWLRRGSKTRFWEAPGMRSNAGLVVLMALWLPLMLCQMGRARSPAFKPARWRELLGLFDRLYWVGDRVDPWGWIVIAVAVLILPSVVLFILRHGWQGERRQHLLLAGTLALLPNLIAF